MTMFRRKPGKPVDCVQYWRAQMWKEPLASHPGIAYDDQKEADYVTTIHDQRVYLADGDWILPEPDGVRFYPCKPEVFADSYEPA